MLVSPNSMWPLTTCAVRSTRNSESPYSSTFGRWCALSASSTASGCRLNSSCIFSSKASSGSYSPTQTKPTCGSSSSSLICSRSISRCRRPSSEYEARLRIIASRVVGSGSVMPASWPARPAAASSAPRRQLARQRKMQRQHQKHPFDVLLRPEGQELQEARDRGHARQRPQQEAEHATAPAVMKLAAPRHAPAAGQQPEGERAEQEQILVAMPGEVLAAEPDEGHQRARQP